MIVVMLVTYFTYARIAEVDIALTQHGLSIARQLAPGAELPLFAGDTATLQRLADAAVRESNVARITISDAHGQVLADRQKLESAKNELVTFINPVMQTLVEGDFPGQMYGTVGPRKLGEIVVTMSLSAAQREQRQLLLIGFGLGLLGVLVAIGLAFAIGASVIRPIQRLAAAMLALGSGRRPTLLPSSGGGEFRTLNEGFNEMAMRLRATARDLEQRIDEATRALIVEKDAAEQATKAKSRLIAVASHDLRQPLHAIGLFAATLQRRTQGSAVEGVIHDLAQSVAVMEKLFDSLLDISRLDAKTLSPESKALALDHLFTQLAAEHIDAANKKKVRLYLRRTTLVVVSDGLLLHRLLSNLLANAIRYTTEGTVFVCARSRGDHVQIEVRDSGIGIPLDKQREIFQEFYQIGNAARDDAVGLGLGLAIVARIAQLLQTEVIVRSAPGRGSLFYLRMRCGTADTVHERPTRGLDQGVQRLERASLSVLVVDDNPLVLAGNRALLEDLGCQVATARDTLAAQTLLPVLADRPIVVLCDLWLSGERSGIEVLRTLSELSPVAIFGVLISADTRPETIQDAKAAGYPLLHKPVSPAQLRAVIMHFAERCNSGAVRDFRHEDSAR
jgi:signal transduction histidine kinase